METHEQELRVRKHHKTRRTHNQPNTRQQPHRSKRDTITRLCNATNTNATVELKHAAYFLPRHSKRCPVLPHDEFGQFGAALSKMSLNFSKFLGRLRRYTQCSLSLVSSSCLASLLTRYLLTRYLLSLKLSTTTETHDHRDTHTQQFSAGLVVNAALLTLRNPSS